MRFEMKRDEALIGRHPDVDVQLMGDAVSRQHAVITEAGGKYTIEDIQSTNGTMVNGRRVGFAELHDGDEIQIGQNTLEFRLE